MRNKKFSSAVAIFTAVIAVFSAANFACAAETCDDHIVINQIYGGGGNSGAPYKNDFIELYNPTKDDVSIEGWSVQYATTNGSFTSANTTVLSGNIGAKSYYLIAEAQGNGDTEDLPAPDGIGTTNLSSAAGKIALTDNTDTTVDTANYSGGSNTKSLHRDINACPTAFSADTPNPRNSSLQENGEDEDSENTGTDDGEVERSYPIGIVVNEILPDPEGDDKVGEFIELYNGNDFEVQLENWSLINRTGNSFSFPADWKIGSRSFLAIYYKDSKLTLHNSDGEKIVLSNPNGDSVSEIFFTGKAEPGQSYARNNGNFFWTSTPTPDGENKITLPEERTDNDGENNNLSSAEKVFFNEILPNPKDDSNGEYIEIVNGESDPVDLYKWTIRDGSKNGKYVFKEHKIVAPGEYFAIYRPQSKLALNNSDESITLFNPRGEITSSVLYETSLKNSSYNFGDTTWKWSKYLTPGEKNKFDSEPMVKIEKPKKVYKNMLAEFSVKAKDKETKKLKYAWSFGDGKKSTLKRATHKYQDTGKYTVTLVVSDDSQTIEKSFTVKVKNSPRPDLEIVKIVSNPAGKDADGEIIEIKNNSNKKVDLDDWKIATGSGEKMYNHPISGKIVLSSGETQAITREFSKFALNNRAGKAQLAMSDGKIVDEVEYAKEKIADDETYAKINGEWQWLAANTGMDTESSHEETELIDDPTGEIEAAESDEVETEEEGEVLGTTDENETVVANHSSSFSPEDAYIFLNRIYFSHPSTPTNYCPASDYSSNLVYLLASTI